MRIALISREYPPDTHVGGIATYSRTAARLLARKGHEVHVLANGSRRSLVPDEGVLVHRIPMDAHPLPDGRAWYRYRSAYRNWLPTYLEVRTWAATVARYAAERMDLRAFDAVEYPETNGEGLLLASVPGVRKIARIHSSWLDEYAANPLERRLLLWWQRRSCLAADLVVSPSRFMIDGYVRTRLGLKRPVRLSRNPLELWSEPVDWRGKDMRHFLFVGRVEHRKGIVTLLDALEALPPASEVTLRVAGALAAGANGPDRTALERFRRARERGFPGARLQYIGPVPHGDLRAQYDWAGVVIMPSLMDNYPYVALEALSRGCFVLGSRAGGIPEIIRTPSEGLLFEPENCTQLAEKMRECLHRRESILEGLGAAAARIQAEFTESACYEELISVYGGGSGP